MPVPQLAEGKPKKKKKALFEVVLFCFLLFSIMRQSGPKFKLKGYFKGRQFAGGQWV